MPSALPGPVRKDSPAQRASENRSGDTQQVLLVISIGRLCGQQLRVSGHD